WQCHPHVDQCPALLLGVGEMCVKPRNVGKLEVIGGKFALGLPKDLAVGDATRAVGSIVVEIEDTRDALYVHRQALEPIGQLGRDRVAFKPSDLLEIRKLADLHTVEPDLPAEPPGA